MRAALAFGIVTVAFAFVAAGCGGDDEPTATTSAAAWAEEFCGAVRSWTEELQRVGDDLGDPSSLSIDSLRAAADDVGAATDAFIEDIRALGAPDTESGAEVEAALDSLADTIEKEKDDIEESLQDVSGIAGAASAVGSVASSLSAMGGAFQTAFEKIGTADTGELETAFQDAAACDALTG